MLIPLLLLQIQVTGYTTPPSGDTVGYWQQRVRYDLVARLDEARATLVGEGTMRYVNNSPDTLRELYFHQYLNAFRPASMWSAADERENRVRFQQLRDPDHGFERFTREPWVNGVAVAPEYPLAPDSTVVRVRLPQPLVPGDSLEVTLAWEARPSTVPRRQGRRGRQYDFAHWYPRIAVYDRGGWQHRPLVPAGEFYGEFGDYDVTFILPDDQVVGATGLPVEGDPGWDRVRAWGTAYPQSAGYGEVDAPRIATGPIPNGYRSVRFVARDVHHFGWAASPDFVYEGGLYDGRIAVHVLYRPENARAWGRGQAAERMARSLTFLEQIFGRYVYPQVTNLNRLDGGGTEFPMLMMNATASQGLILHELAHIYVHGILSNNEWRHAWIDEGLASYLTLWGQGFAAHERGRGLGPGFAPIEGYAGLALRPDQFDAGEITQFRHDLLGRAEPMGTLSHEFSEFGVYNAMSYGRAELMWSAVRDVMGDSVFVTFLRELYARWQLRHVDELAIRAVASDVHGHSLDWFFDQWVHRTGLIDYELRDVRSEREGNEWVTRVRVLRRGEYRHPVPVGVRAGEEWMIERARADADDQWLEFRTGIRPADIRVDPQGVVPDWDRRNHVRGALGTRAAIYTFDRPFLTPVSRSREIRALTPIGWYTGAGGLAIGLRERRNYHGWLDLREFGVTYALRDPAVAESEGGVGWWERFNVWLSAENPRLPFAHRPLVGWRFDAWNVDAITRLGVRRRWDLSRFYLAPGTRTSLDVAVNATDVRDTHFVDARWTDATVADVSGELSWRPVGISGFEGRVLLIGGTADAAGDDDGFFWRAEGEIRRRVALGDRAGVRFRLFAGSSDNAPPQRSLGLAALDPTETFGQHLYRGARAPLARPSVHYVPLGGAGVRAFGPGARIERAVAANVELERALRATEPRSNLPRVSLAIFADGAGVQAPWLEDGDFTFVADAGLGFTARGALFDRTVALRFDVPLYVSHPQFAVSGEEDRVRFRWTVSLNDLW